ncbi:protein SLOW WALKER 1 [Oryza brachyantha]|uniref:U3 small nucleolar RNA-associated protein 15 C-terminal domain-containing protein n=1 Tax=Oryza brachyantha TaxID=4533 RepID=J3MJI3_ORYBR|nr:protein SLOW WALKER 1 [Oryza brachyantha]
MAADTSKPFFPAAPHSALVPSGRKASRLSPESSYWRSFRASELTSPSEFNVTHLAFSPSPSPAPTLAASWATSVLLFSGDPLSPLPRLSVSDDVTFSPSFRSDGALLAVGDKKGVVRVFRPDKKSSGPLRTLRGHSAETRVVRYPVAGGDKVHLFTAGNDALLSYWDVPSETPVFTVPAAHRDYIRAGAASPVDHNIFATGSYDHTVKLWDARTGQTPSLSFSHGELVESVLFLPSGGLLATAGGNMVKIWDVIGGGRLVHSVESHVKTVMALALAKMSSTGETRLLSAGSDGYVKCFDYGELKLTHSMRYPMELLSLACSPCGTVLVAGSSKGVIFMGRRKKKQTEDDEEEGKGVGGEFDWAPPKPEKTRLTPSSHRYFLRGQNAKAKKGDFVIEKPKKVKFAEHDKLLRKFRHKDALVSALAQKNPRSAVAVMEELIARRKLVRCIGNLQTKELEKLLLFLHRNATLPRYARFLMGVANKVLEIRANDIRSDENLRGCIRNLKRMVTEEIQIQHTLQGIQGMISPMLVLASR